MTTRLTQVLNGKRLDPPPVWFMRQAGRYLPEYLKLRAQAGSFIDFCLNADMAAEATLQPIERFDFDAAIIFADILLIPLAMGQRVSFVAGEGPKLEPLADNAAITDYDFATGEDRISAVYETVRKVRAGLSDEKAVIGFAGAPWTVATYMINGGSMKDPGETRAAYFADGPAFEALLEKLVDATVHYLGAQIEAGADAVQLFESWASGLPPDLYRKFCIAPAKAIRMQVAEKHPNVPFTLFSKGSGLLLRETIAEVAPNGAGLDVSIPLDRVADILPQNVAAQGALDPLLLAAGGDRLESETRRQLELLANRPHIFNLGHGILPHTPLENVARVVKIVKSFGSA